MTVTTIDAQRVRQEDAWVRRAKRGDVDAFEALYRSHVRQVYGVCRRLLNHDQDAEDITQQVFLRAWQRLASFRGESRFGTWIKRVAANMVVDARRANWKQALETPHNDGDPVDQGMATAGESRAATRLDLEELIQRLPSGARQVLVLHDVEGYTHEETASMLGVSVGTTKTQLFRARRALRNWLL